MNSKLNRIRSKWSYKRNRLWQEIGNIVGRPLGKPREVWLKVTHRCKTQCVMCDIWKSPSRISEELSIEQWKTVLDDLRAWLGPYNVWFTGGEAFAKKDLVQLFSHCARIGLSSRVITRGVGVYDEPTAREIIDSGLDEYHVSIEALNPEMHDAVSPPQGTYANAVEGLKWLNALRRSEGSPLRIVIKTIIMGYNREEILRIVDWAFTNKFDEIKFQPLEQTIEQPEADPRWFERSEFWPRDEGALKKVIQVIDELIRLKTSGAPIHNSVRELGMMRRYFLSPIQMYEPVKSHMLKTAGTIREPNDGWMEIWHNGDVKTFWKNPPIGNARDKPIWKIWNARPTPPPKSVRVFGLLK